MTTTRSRLAPVLLLLAGFSPVALASDPCGCYQHYDMCLQGCAGGEACAQGCQDRYDYCTRNCTVHTGLQVHPRQPVASPDLANSQRQLPSGAPAGMAPVAAQAVP